MRKSVENLATSKITGGRRSPLRIRRKYETDRYPNEAINGAQVTVTRRVRGSNNKVALKSIDFVNLAISLLILEDNFAFYGNSITGWLLADRERSKVMPSA